MVKTKIKPIQRLFGDAGAVINEFEKSDFKVDAATIQRANDLKPILLEKMRYDTHYSLESGLFLNALVIATKIEKGENLRVEFDATCHRINSLLEGRDGVWP